ncbi:hypothetical protein VHEMI04353 [[Torrubiella] hemipterigena]|uniref:NAD-dependent epimerase/dehydratase domain-containing protein n=1 Tax=[Torrubiella] hemipterigena TaxID=1531966 RepID=A0A0A1TE05_9HYPO|nr:hypothetical protein VHEMI04353 [[Torrubiella] hemipterigena]
MSLPKSPSKPIHVLVNGANGYLGAAVCRSFLRARAPPGRHYVVYGLVRRESTADALARDEVIPIVGSISDPDGLSNILFGHSKTWDVIATCTEPSKVDAAVEAQHWTDIIHIIVKLATSSVETANIRPFVLWSSGCKDYGTTLLHGDSLLKAHDESSPIQPVPQIKGRTEGARRAIEASDKNGGSGAFDIAVLRPTPLYGYSGSYYSAAFAYMDEYAAAIQGHRQTADKVKLGISGQGILHGLHVDDCSDAYVALAETALYGTTANGGLDAEAGRAEVSGQVFNIGTEEYETVEQIVTALSTDYGFVGAEFDVPEQDLPESMRNNTNMYVFGHSQWVASEKIRRLTGWRERRPLFYQNISVYRLAYEAARQTGDDVIGKVQRRFGGNWNEEAK